MLKNLIASLLLFVLAAPAAAQTKLLRFPALHGNRVVFTYGGDLWTVSDMGGTATRVTSHPGLELFARFSPDGQSIAFTGQYDGDEQVYVVPSAGGVPKQLTYYPARGPLAERWGYDHQVYDWTPDGSRILFRSWRESWANSTAKLFTVAATGGPAEALPMPEGGSGSYAADGRRIVYSPGFRDFRSEKRYGGGQANRLRIFDLQRNTSEKIPEFKRAQRDAMWIGNMIYFNSDEDGTFNLYAYDPTTKQTRQVTKGKTWDVRWPSADAAAGRIVYELGGELQIMDTKTGSVRKLDIHVPTDAVAARASRVAVTGALIEDFELSPHGERALFTGRGDVFTAPIERGAVRNLTLSSGAHDREAQWSPDGRNVVYISDRSGEEELWLVSQDGTGKPEQLTRGGTARRYAPRWSADGSRIAFNDKDGKLFVLTLAGRSVVQVADDPVSPSGDHSWSPRGNLLAYSLNNARGIASLFIWDAADNRSHPIMEPFFGETSPAWDPDGNFLYYLSERDYQPQLSTREWNIATNRMTRVYAVALRKDVQNPFPVMSDEVKIADTTAAKPVSVSVAGTAGQLRIDYDGISRRAVLVPIDADNISSLSANKGNLLYVVSGSQYYSRESERRPALKLYSIADRKETTLSDNAGGYALSHDGLKVLVNEAGTYALYDAKPGAPATKKTVATNGMFVERNPTEEWAQIFDEVWRRYRDYFYVPNMHGNDWEALRAQYRPLLAYVSHRSDLNYLIAEMIGELSIQHAYIAGGDWQSPQRPAVALPGARFSLDRATGKYRISKIYAGQNEEPNFRSPLTELGVDVKEGDYVLAIDGIPLSPTEDPYRLLRNRADRPVTLTVSSSASGQDTREARYRPVTSEQDLIYLDWVMANRARVAQLSNGTVGYIHIPDMGAPGLREFIKWFYPQIDMGGMVVDVRANGGGNISSMIIDRLRRTPLAAGFSRTSDIGTQYPRTPAFRGALVAILNENSSSDGDIFPAMFKAAGLGPLVGKRSWGGVVGITNRGNLIDGGVVNVPEFGFANLNGEWIIEGYGVDPDIEVEQDPAAVLAGRDPQLERAVKEVMDTMKKRPMVVPVRPQPPVKIKR